MATDKKKSKKPEGVICVNRRARHDYDILETLECGLVLLGTEIKSIRDGNADISDAYAVFTGGEFWLLNARIAPYSHGGKAYNHEERRTRKLLIHALELHRLKEKKEHLSLTVVPLKMYWKGARVKVEVALARGRKAHDKREAIKDRDWQRNKARILRQG